jgi:hypothetical protein
VLGLNQQDKFMEEILRMIDSDRLLFITVLQLRFSTGEIFNPTVRKSSLYSRWVCIIDLKTCRDCVRMNGSVYCNLSLGDKANSELAGETPPMHPNCRCEIRPLTAIAAGTATIDGLGADFYVKTTGKLPSYYISKTDAMNLGWVNYMGNLDKVAPGKMIFGVYENRNKKLPDTEGRQWMEADINYRGGFRNSHRVVFSNDGLMFVTYDHYKTFYEIV